MKKYINLPAVAINKAKDILSKESYDKIKSLRYDNGQCLENAKKVAKAIGCSIIEGIVIFHDNSSIRHAWNVFENDIYFDMTAEVVWQSFLLSKSQMSLEGKSYHIIERHSYSEYKKKDKNEFLSDAPIISNCRNAYVVVSNNGNRNDFIDKLLPSQDAAETIRERYWNDYNNSDFMNTIIDVIQNEYRKEPNQILGYILNN